MKTTDEIIELPLEDVVYEEKYYPRDQWDQDKVNLYRLNLSKLPPIIIQKENKILIDGYHRLMAHRVERSSMIKAKVMDVLEKDILWWATKLNATHGLQLSMPEKKRLARDFIGNGHSTSEIAETLAVDSSAVRKWTQEKRQKIAEEQDASIWNLYLRLFTQEEIAEKLGESQQTIANRLDKITKNGKYPEICKPPDELQFGNHWPFTRRNEDYGMDGVTGRIAGQIVEHVLWYFTKPPRDPNGTRIDNCFDVVVDPMAGGGTTLDVCLAMGRRCLASDLTPIRDDILQHDITQGFPEKARNCDLIFLDPPYYDMVFEEMFRDLPEFYNFIGILASGSWKTIKPSGIIALLMGDITKDAPIVLTGDCYSIFRDTGFKPLYHIAAPHSTQQFSGQDINWSKKYKKLLGQNRSLFIFQKPEETP